jgi:hypothetical protein
VAAWCGPTAGRAAPTAGGGGAGGGGGGGGGPARGRIAVRYTVSLAAGLGLQARGGPCAGYSWCGGDGGTVTALGSTPRSALVTFGARPPATLQDAVLWPGAVPAPARVLDPAILPSPVSIRLGPRARVRATGAVAADVLELQGGAALALQGPLCAGEVVMQAGSELSADGPAPLRVSVARALVVCCLRTAGDIEVAALGSVVWVAGGNCSLSAGGRATLAAGGQVLVPGNVSLWSGGSMSLAAAGRMELCAVNASAGLDIRSDGDVVLLGGCEATAGGNGRVWAGGRLRMDSGSRISTGASLRAAAGELSMGDGASLRAAGWDMDVEAGGDAVVCGLEAPQGTVRVRNGGFWI